VVPRSPQHAQHTHARRRRRCRRRHRGSTAAPGDSWPCAHLPARPNTCRLQLQDNFIDGGALDMTPKAGVGFVLYRGEKKQTSWPPVEEAVGRVFAVRVPPPRACSRSRNVRVWLASLQRRASVSCNTRRLFAGSASRRQAARHGLRRQSVASEHACMHALPHAPPSAGACALDPSCCTWACAFSFTAQHSTAQHSNRLAPLIPLLLRVTRPFMLPRRNANSTSTSART